MNDTEIDRHLIQWLRGGPSSASPRVLQAVVGHVHAQRPINGVLARWHTLAESVALRWPAQVAIRPIVLLALLALSFALGAVVYASWQQNRVVTPIPSPTESPQPSASLSPADVYVCPPGTNPDQAGDPTGPRPSMGFKAAIDDKAGLLVLPTNDGVWLFDLCHNTWRQSGAQPFEVGVPVYDPSSGQTVIIGPNAVQVYDSTADTMVRIGPHPRPDSYGWSAVHDPISGLIVARDGATSDMWTYDIDRDEWQAIDQLGDVPQVRNRGQGLAVSEDVMVYDHSADRVVLYRPNSPGYSASTYEFDSRTATWARSVTLTPDLDYSFYDVVRVQAAYDADHARTVIYSSGRLIAYDALANTWHTLLDEPGVASSANGVSTAFDPVGQRVIFVGGAPTGGPGRRDDVTALDLQTLTWTTLLAQSVPPSLPDAGQLRICPPGTHPNAPGPIAQERPPAGWAQSRVALDRDSGRVVVVTLDPVQIWTFDVCTNTWRRSDVSPDIERPVAIVYDAWHDVTALFSSVSGDVLLYDADADTLTAAGAVPETLRVSAAHAVFRLATGEVIVRDDDASTLWTYDVFSGEWQPLEQDGDIPPGLGTGAALLAYGDSVDRLVLYAKSPSGSTGYEYDFGSGTWALQQPDPPDVMLIYGDLGYGEIAYDEAHRRTVVFSRGRLLAYDATAQEWQVVVDSLMESDPPVHPGDISHRQGVNLVYDPVNARVLSFGGNRRVGDQWFDVDDVVAFDLSDNSWTVLLEATSP